jgi:hypothetical protein
MGYDESAQSIQYGPGQQAAAAGMLPGYNRNLKEALSAAKQETELGSILSTLRTQAVELRSQIAAIYDRVSPRCENENCGEGQCFGGNYVGRAEEVRSIQREAIDLLIELSKFV